MRVAVIGAGAAGVVCARHLTEHGAGHTCVVFEQTGCVGGTWVYTDRVGEDEFGQPIHTSMYKSLRTNLPKEVMGFPDFPIPEHEDSYIPSEYILKLINEYADHYQVKNHIKFYHQVRLVEPREDSGWNVTVKNLQTNEENTSKFDAIMVCNGHYWLGYMPNLEGRERFAGLQMHSHDYRTPEKFRDRNVLVIGAGPSGMDLALEIASVAKKVILSHHSRDTITTQFPANVIQRPDVANLSSDTVMFVDKTSERIDSILYCTGFLYAFPFLSGDCGVTVEENHVQPLYKHLIHIDHPTLCFIGLPFYVCAFIMFDIQVQFFLRTLDGTVKLPSRDAMIEDANKDQQKRQEMGLGRRQAHMLGPLQGEYFDDLCAMGGIERVPPVMAALHFESSKRFLEDLVHYRLDKYRIVDEETFVQIE